MIYLELFLAFLKVGCFAFGGAYGAIPLIQEVVLFHSWIDPETLLYFIAVSESTPGPIMVNLATYVGSQQGGIFGAVVATVGVVLPSFMIILLITAVFKGFLKNRNIQAILKGIKPALIGIIIATGVFIIYDDLISCSLVSHPTIDWRGAIIFGILLLSIILNRKFFKKSISPISLILISACIGMVFYSI
ncbi:MAG: chromate transporter [Eubacteriales bacterium]